MVNANMRTITKRVTKTSELMRIIALPSFDTHWWVGCHTSLRSLLPLIWAGWGWNVFVSCLVDRGSTFTPDFGLAHLSHRLTMWANSKPMVERLSASVRPIVNHFKELLLRNRLVNQSQILCGAYSDRGSKGLFLASGSHDQNVRHAHISSGRNPSKIFFAWTNGPITTKLVT